MGRYAACPSTHTMTSPPTTPTHMDGPGWGLGHQPTHHPPKPKPPTIGPSDHRLPHCAGPPRDQKHFVFDSRLSTKEIRTAGMAAIPHPFAEKTLEDTETSQSAVGGHGGHPTSPPLRREHAAGNVCQQRYGATGQALRPKAKFSPLKPQASRLASSQTTQSGLCLCVTCCLLAQRTCRWAVLCPVLACVDLLCC